MLQPFVNDETVLKNKVNIVYLDPIGSSKWYVELCQTEMESFEIFVGTLGLSLACLKKGGDLIVRVRTTLLRTTVCLIEAVASAFDSVCIHKPETIAAWTQDRYFIYI